MLSAQAEPSPFISLWVFSYLKGSFSPYKIYVNALSRILVQGVSLSSRLLISTSVSMKSDRSQGSKPISQVPPGKCWSYLLFKRGWLRHCILPCSPSNPSSMPWYFPEGWCLTPRQVMHREKSGLVKKQLSKWDGETHVDGNGLWSSLIRSLAHWRSLHVWLILFLYIIMKYAFFAAFPLVCLISH